MANSMTAFARSELSTDQGNLAWELRSVNHRYLEVTLRLPEAFRELEGPLRELLRKQVARGKVECTLRFNPAEQQSSELSLNQPLLDQPASPEAAPAAAPAPSTKPAAASAGYRRLQEEDADDVTAQQQQQERPGGAAGLLHETPLRTAAEADDQVM